LVNKVIQFLAGLGDHRRLFGTECSLYMRATTTKSTS